MDKNLMETLVARAEQKAKSRTEAKEFDVPDVGKLLFVKPSQSKTLEFFERMADSSGAADIFQVGVDMIYDCCPTLQDAELQAALAIVEPTDIVPRLMDVWQIDKLSGMLSRWLGLTEDKAEQTVKNS
ncbi:MAG: hypothetical protein PUI99_08915 [Clostridiales bacterium]|nr:hypothetical protein [Clostridiales bacterium]